MSQRELSGIGANPIRVIDATNGNESYTLPVNFAVNRRITVRRVDGSGNTVTVTAPNGTALNGANAGSVVIDAASEATFIPIDPNAWQSFGSAAKPGVYPRTTTLTDPQFRGIPTVMTSPPTVLVTNDSDGTTSMGTVRTQPGVSYTSIVCDDLTKYTPLGVGTSAPIKGSVGIQAFACRWQPTVNGPVAQRLEFLFDGSVLEFCVRQFAGTQYRLMVDGQYVTSTIPQNLGGTGNLFGGIKMTFGSRAIRRIGIEVTANGAWFAGVWLQLTDTMRAVAPPSRRLNIFGDSYTGGAASSAMGSWGGYVGPGLGYRDVVNAGLGGSGWIQQTGGKDALNRLTEDLVATAPTDVIFALGHNDTSSAPADITARVQAVLAATRLALPNLRSLVVTGAFFQGGSAGTYTPINAAIQTGCVASGATFIDTITNPVFTGTGRVGATASNGNSDLYITTDGVHPTDAGSLWLGQAMTQAISAALA